MRARRFLVSAVGVALAASAASASVVMAAQPQALVGRPLASVADPATPVFGVPRVVDPIHAYGEPDIAVDPKTGAIEASGPQGTGTQRSIWNISVDGGDSYRIVQNLPAGTGYPSQAEPTKSLVAPGGGDTEIQVAHTGQTFFNDLAGLACFSATTTYDDGATTAPANPDACSDPGADRQWIALYDPNGKPTISPYKGATPLAYMEYQGQTSGADVVDTSTDGTTYSHKAGQFGDTANNGPDHTPIIVDTYTGDVLGMTSNNSDGTGLALAVGTPDVTGDLTYSYNTVAAGSFDPQTLFPVLTEDSARTLYAVWVDGSDFQVRYAYSKVDANGKGWHNWSTPTVLNTAPANVNVFPWIVAGGPGIVDVGWYGTDQTLAQLGTDGPSAKVDETWNLFFDQVTTADSATPVNHQVIAAPHPMHYNDICLLGTLCISGAGNRNQADFFKLVLAADGRARIIYTDSSNRLSQTVGNDSAADHQGAALDTIVTQEGGVNAFTGQPLVPRETTAPISSITDPKGDALFKPLGGTNVPAADITKLALQETGGNLVISTTTAGGTLGDAATAAATAFAELTVRWQMGDTLYYAGIEQATAGGPLLGYAGPTQSIDLCSVSGCKPNYLTYGSATGSDGASTVVPTSTTVTQTRNADGSTTYVETVPLSAVGSPAAAATLEEVMGFVTVSTQAAQEPITAAEAFADEVPLQIEGTKTFNFNATAAPTGTTTAPTTPVAPTTAATTPATTPTTAGTGTASPAPTTRAPITQSPKVKPRASQGAPVTNLGGNVTVARLPATKLAFTGLSTTLTVLALTLILAGLGLLGVRRQRRGQP